MLYWFGFDDFQPITSTVFDEDACEIVNEARSLLPGWSDEDVLNATALLRDQCESYAEYNLNQ